MCFSRPWLAVRIGALAVECEHVTVASRSLPDDGSRGVSAVNSRLVLPHRQSC